MTLDDQVAVIDQLPPDEQEALSLVCQHQDEEVPELLLVELLKKRLVVRKRAAEGYTVVSHWVHYAWQIWQSRQEEEYGSLP